MLEQTFALGNDPRLLVPGALLPVHVRLEVLVRDGVLERRELAVDILVEPPGLGKQRRVVRPVAVLGFGAVPDFVGGCLSILSL